MRTTWGCVENSCFTLSRNATKIQVCAGRQGHFGGPFSRGKLRGNSGEAAFSREVLTRGADARRLLTRGCWSRRDRPDQKCAPTWVLLSLLVVLSPQHAGLGHVRESMCMHLLRESRSSFCLRGCSASRNYLHFSLIPPFSIVNFFDGCHLLLHRQARVLEQLLRVAVHGCGVILTFRILLLTSRSVGGVTYAISEHYFQARKVSGNPEVFAKVLRASTPGKAKAIAKESGWSL